MPKVAYTLEDGLVVGSGFSVDVSSQETSATKLRLTSVVALGIATTEHAFQIGTDTGENLVADNLRIQARTNGVASKLLINPHGGNIEFLGINNITIKADGEIYNTGSFKYWHQGSIEPTFNDNLNVLGDVTITGTLDVGGLTADPNPFMDDPIFRIGDNTTDVNVDLGIEFEYNDGVAKTGFFGYDDTDGKFKYLLDTANTASVISGTQGTIVATFEGDASALDHDSLTNYDVNQHIDHTTITFTAGSGLTGGGTLAANRTFDVDWAGTGVATTIARSDHDHDTSYLALSGGTITGSLVINTNLTVSGTVNFIDSNVVNIGDSILTLNADFASDPPTENGGIEIERGTVETNATLLWNETADKWQIDGVDIATGGATSDYLPLAGGDLTGRLTVANNLNSVVVISQIATSLSNATYTVDIDSSAQVSNMTAAGAFRVQVNSGNALVINGVGDSIFGGDITSEQSLGSTLTLGSTNTTVGDNELFGGIEVTTSDISGGGTGIIGALRHKAVAGGAGGASYWEFTCGGSVPGNDAIVLTLSGLDLSSTFAGDVSLATGKQLYFDGGSDTYIEEGIANNIWLYGGGSRKARFGSAGIFFENADVVIGQSVSIDSVTDSSSTITGSIQTDGGLGVAKKLFVGDSGNFAGDVTSSHAGNASFITQRTAGAGGKFASQSARLQLGTTTAHETQIIVNNVGVLTLGTNLDATFVGAVKIEADVSGSRPSSLGAGTMWFDTTLGIPIWHDGTNWIDATGTTV